MIVVCGGAVVDLFVTEARRPPTGGRALIPRRPFRWLLLKSQPARVTRLRSASEIAVMVLFLYGADGVCLLVFQFVGSK